MAHDPMVSGHLLANEIERQAARIERSRTGLGVNERQITRLGLYVLEYLPDILAALRAPQGDGAEAMRWRLTGASTGMLNGVGGTVEWFRPADGQTRSFPAYFDPNVGAYVGLSFSSSTLPALDQHSLTKNQGGGDHG